MKKLLNPIAASGLMFISSLGVLNGQITTDFSASEGYVDGALHGQVSSSWTTWNSNAIGDSTWTVDSSGAGALIINPSQDNWQDATYVGPGSSLNSNTYYGEVRFTVDFANGTEAIASGATALPNYTIRGSDNDGEQFFFALRHAPWSADLRNKFNVFSGNTINGGWDSSFSAGFDGSDIGLALDGSHLWTDGQSDELLLSFSAVHLGGNNWEESVSLTNVTTTTVIVSETRTIVDANGSFASQSGHFLQMNDDNMQIEAVAVAIDSINIATVPEPSTVALLAGLSALGLVLYRRRRAS